ncbi:hypothetical protein ACWEWI_39545 [Streptomyces sp. NPDC003753]
MATPVSLFRPHAPVRSGDEHPEQAVAETELSVEVVEPPVLPPQGTAVEFDVRVPPSGEITLVTGRQRVGIHQALAGRTLTVWANHRSVHLLLDGHLVTTVPSRLRPEDIAYLTMRYGARPAGSEPAPAARPRAPQRHGHPRHQRSSRVSLAHWLHTRTTAISRSLLLRSGVFALWKSSCSHCARRLSRDEPWPSASRAATRRQCLWPLF